MGLFLSFISVAAINLCNAKDIEYNAGDTNWDVDTVEDALNELYQDNGSNAKICEALKSHIYAFDYTGSVQDFTIPCDGNYLLEVWGAQGESDTALNGALYIGGYGGYAKGQISLKKDQNLYIFVGGQEGKINGGKDDFSIKQCVSAATTFGGDSTHILFVNEDLNNLQYRQASILIVAGGGGGAGAYKSVSTPNYSGNGGAGGGIRGNNGGASGLCYWRGTGGTQTSGGTDSYCSGINSSIDGGIQSYYYGTFGKGGNSNCSSGGAGGGGYYGGASSHYAGGGGGSGYIGNPLLTEKAMYCYNCTTSQDPQTLTISVNTSFSEPVSKVPKQGNGYAKITYLGK